MYSQKFVCKFCSNIFKNKSSLEIHLREHTRDRFYACSLCEKSFKNSNDFNNHLETHSSERPSNGVIIIDFCDNQSLSDGYQTDNESGDLLKNSTQQICFIKCKEKHMDVTNQYEVKKEEFLDNESVQDTKESSNLLKNSTHPISINHGSEENININKCFNPEDEDQKEFLDNLLEDINNEVSPNVYNHSDIKEDKEEFLDNNSISDSIKSTNLLGDRKYQISAFVNKNHSDIKEDEEEFLDTKSVPDAKEFTNLLEDTNNQICVNVNTNHFDEDEDVATITDAMEATNAVEVSKHEVTNLLKDIKDRDEDFGIVTDAMENTNVKEISKTQFTNSEFIANAAKRLNKSNTLKNGDITDLLTEFVCELCFKSFSQLHHLKTHLSVHANVYKTTLHEKQNGKDFIKKSKASKFKQTNSIKNVSGKKSTKLPNSYQKRNAKKFIQKKEILPKKIGEENFKTDKDISKKKLKREQESKACIKKLNNGKIVKRKDRKCSSENKLNRLTYNHQKEHPKEIAQNEDIDQNENGEENFESRTSKDDTLKVVQNSANQSQQIQIFKNDNTKTRLSKLKITRVDNKCAICNKIFYFQRDLFAHATQVHPNVKSLKCRECDEYFIDSSSLSYHFRVHKEISQENVSETISSKSANVQILSVEILNAAGETWGKMGLEENSNLKDSQQIQFEDDRNGIIKERRSQNLKSSCKKLKLAYNRCAVCKKIFKFQRDLIRHTLQYHPNSKALKCCSCNEFFNNIQNLKSRYINRLKQKSNTSDKESTKESYEKSNKQGYDIKHQQSDRLEQESNSKAYKKRDICSVCNKMFTFKRDLIKHAQQYHAKTNALKCRICKNLFRNRKNLTRHSKIHTDFPKTRVGSFCSKSYYKHRKLKRHLQADAAKLPQRPNDCSLENQQRQKEQDLNDKNCKTKKKAVRAKRNLCEICPNVLGRSKYLQAHVRTHTLERMMYSKTFKTKYKLQSKLKSHPSERPYSCSRPICKKSFRHLRRVHFKKLSNKQNDELDFELKQHKRNPIERKSSNKDSNETHSITIKSKLVKSIVKKSILADRKCAVCNKMFTFQRDLIKHAQQYHSKTKALKCRKCKGLFRNIKKLTHHSKIHTNFPKKHYGKFCSKSDYKLSKLKHHLKADVAKRPQQPNDCSLEYQQRQKQQDLNDKTCRKNNSMTCKKKAVRPKKFLCEFCPKVFNNSTSLQSHIRTHTGECPYSCTLCSKTFKTQSAVQYHLTSHSSERPYSCPICKKFFKTTAQVNKHKKTHSKERPYSCSVCSQAFTRSDHLKRHAKCHNKGHPYACTLCDKAFKQKPSLEKHKKFHLEGSQIKQNQFVCEKCPKSFDKAYNLRIHLRQHNARFTCEYCSKPYYQLHHLETHLRVHTGERPFVCSICKKNYKHKRALRNHLKTHLREDSNNRDEELSDDCASKELTSIRSKDIHASSDGNDIKTSNEKSEGKDLRRSLRKTR